MFGRNIAESFSDLNIVLLPKASRFGGLELLRHHEEELGCLFRRPVAGKTRERRPLFIYALAVRHGLNKACREICCSCHGSNCLPRHLLSVGSQTARRHHNLTLRPYPSQSIAVATSSSFGTIFSTSRSTKATK